MPDEWDQYATKPAATGGDEWAQYASKPAGPQLPGMHATPKPQMQTVTTPSSLLSTFGSHFVDNINPINIVKGIGDQIKGFYASPEEQQAQAKAALDAGEQDIKDRGMTGSVVNEAAGMAGDATGQAALGALTHGAIKAAPAVGAAIKGGV